MNYYDITIRDNDVDIIVTQTKPPHQSALKTLQKIKEALEKVQLGKEKEERLVVLARRICTNYNAKVEKTHFITRFFIKLFGDYKQINALHRQIAPAAEMPDDIVAIFAKNWIEDWLHGKMTFTDFKAKFAINRQYRRIMDTALKEYIQTKTGYTIKGKAIDFVNRMHEKILQLQGWAPQSAGLEELLFFTLIGIRDLRWGGFAAAQTEMDYFLTLPYLKSYGFAPENLVSNLMLYSTTAEQFDQILDLLFPPDLAKEEVEKRKQFVIKRFDQLNRDNRDYKKEMVFLTRLAEKTEDPNLRFEAHRGSYPILFQVIYQGQEELALRLLKLPGVQVYDDCLWEAARHGLSQVTEFLLKKGAKPNCPLQGMTPIQIALDKGHWQIVKQLLQDNRIDIGKDLAGDSDFILAMRKASPAPILALMLEKNANVNEIDSRGLSPLIYAIRNRDTEAIQILLAKGANLDQQTHAGTARQLLLASGLRIPEQ